MTYVNLLMNPEANTGYKGEEPRRVWAAIHENCPRGLLSELCLEERILRRLMSGFHLSVTTHVASYFHHNQSEHALRVREVLRRYRTALESKTLFEDLHPRFQPNLDMFESVIRSHPDRIQDLYFSYLFLLRFLSLFLLLLLLLMVMVVEMLIRR